MLEPATRPTSAQAPQPTRARKILCVGDSFTDSNGGLDRHLEGLARSATPPVAVQARRIVEGGAPLRRFVHGRGGGGGLRTAQRRPPPCAAAPVKLENHENLKSKSAPKGFASNRGPPSPSGRDTIP